MKLSATFASAYFRNKGAVIKNGTEGGGRDFKICRKIMYPKQEARTVYVAPKCLQK